MKRWIVIVSVLTMLIATGSVEHGRAQEKKQPETVPLKQPIQLPVDLMPPSQAKLDTMFDDIEKEITRLRKAELTAKANDYAGQLKKFRALLNGPYPVPLDQTPEVHVVGISQGFVVMPGHRKQAIVDVQYAGRPIILVLTGSEATKWSVRIGPNVTIKEAIVGGYNDQEVVGLPANTPVTYKVHERNNNGMYFRCYKYGGDGFEKMVQVLKSLTGAEITTFLGSSQADPNGIIIGPNNSDWRVAHIIGEVTKIHRAASEFERERLAAEMRKIKFRAVFHEPMDRFRSKAYLADFTLAGPVKNTMKELPGSIRVAKQIAIDPQTPAYFAIDMHNLYELDLAKNQATELKVDKELERPSWMCGLAYDTARRRLVMTTLSGEGFMYSYDSATKKWTILTSMKNVDLASFAHDANANVFYGLASALGGDGATILYEYDPAGNVNRKLNLSERIGSRYPGASTQMIVVGTQLVILHTPERHGEDSIDQRSRSYLVDLKDGKIVMSCVMNEPE